MTDSGGKGPDITNLKDEFAKKVKLPKVKFRIPGPIILILFFLIIATAVYSSFLEYIRPNEFGIKVKKIGLNRGVQEEVYTT